MIRKTLRWANRNRIGMPRRKSGDVKRPLETLPWYVPLCLELAFVGAPVRHYISYG